MKQYLADLHIHTCLSPCGSLEMSPSEIVRRSLAKGLDAIAITDHKRKRIVWFISRPMNPVSDSNDI